MKPSPTQQASLIKVWRKKGDEDVEENAMDVEKSDAGPSKSSFVTYQVYYRYSWPIVSLKTKRKSPTPEAEGGMVHGNQEIYLTSGQMRRTR
jgi:hypothetical protein